MFEFLHHPTRLSGHSKLPSIRLNHPLTKFQHTPKASDSKRDGDPKKRKNVWVLVVAVLISCFAISTYHTKYFLAKEGLAFDVDYSQISEDQLRPQTRQNGPNTSSVPVFEKDPTIRRLIDLMNGVNSVEETFSIVFVAGWVPSEAVQTAYTNNFLPEIRKCFHESDFNPPLPEGIPNVYLYPSRSLHVTVATLHAFWRPADESTQKILEKEWTDLIRAASKKEGWPNVPLQLSLESAQIGTKAGILLWKELTGGLDQMRVCIKAEAKGRERRLIQAGIDPGTLDIPGIIHSTFLRFNEVPYTPGKEVQEKFEKYVKKEIATLFPPSIVVPDAKLVCERTPYMHIQDDERHVFATFPFSGNEY